MTRGVGAILAAAVLFGTTGTAQALGPDDSTPLSVGAARLLLGGALLALTAALVVGPGALRAAVGPAAVIGAAGVLGYQLAFFTGTARLGVATGTLVALGSAPVFAGLMAWAVGQGRPGRTWVGATALAVVGLALLVGGAGTVAPDASGSGTAAGVLAALGAGAAYAVYTVAAKRMLDDGHAPVAVMGAEFGLGALAAIPVLLLADTGWIASAPGLALVLYLGVVPTAAAYLLFGRGLATLPAPTVATLTLAEPVVAAALGIVVLGERLGAVALLGAALVVAALLWLGRGASVATVPG